MRKELENIKLDIDAIFLGASYGVASYPKDGQDLRSLFDTADKRMYMAKQEKKNSKNTTI